MLEVKFYNKDSVKNSQLDFAVIVSKYNNQWVYCKHKDRNTWEIPGGHREQGETIDMAAKRELYEETGAIVFDLTPVSAYSVKRDTESESFGMLYYANITKLSDLPDSEIEKIDFFKVIPDELTYPLIQPKLQEKIAQFASDI